jgi:hypothetical protein
MVTTVAVLLGCLVLGVEVRRKDVPGGLDFLRAAGLVYLLAFCFVPIYVELAEPRNTTQWLWVTSFDRNSRLTALLIAWLGYVVILCGYGTGGAWIHRRFRATRGVLVGMVATRTARRVGAFCLGGGILAFVLYAEDAGGIVVVMKNSMVMRMVADESLVGPFAFLKNVAPLIMAASYILLGVWQDKAGRRPVDLVLLLVSVAASLALAYHQAGRLNAILYVGVFVLVRPYVGKKIRLAHITAMMVGAVVVIALGKPLFNMYVYSEGLQTAVEQTSVAVGETAGSFVMEMSFPYGNLAGALDAVPRRIPFRWFSDIPIGVARMLPKRLLGIQLPATISQVNSNWHGATAGEIPIDLLSFGYFSSGITGVVLTCFLFGWMLRVADHAFGCQPGAAVPLRVAWIEYLAFRVLYSDPTHWIVTGFGLFIATCLVHWVGRLDGARAAAESGRGSVPLVSTPGDLRSEGNRRRRRPRAAEHAGPDASRVRSRSR